MKEPEEEEVEREKNINTLVRGLKIEAGGGEVTTSGLIQDVKSY